MACACHGKEGKQILDRAVPPDDQCTACASKHINSAKSAWGEFTYEEDNRRYVAGQLRLAIEHLKIDHFETALHCRDVAMLIEENKDESKHDIRNRIDTLLKEAINLFYKDHPDAYGRFVGLNTLPE